MYTHILITDLGYVKGTHHAFTRIRTSPSPTVGSGFFRILTVLSPPKPVRTTARISLGGGVSFSFSSVAFSGVSSGGVSVVPFSVGVFSGAAAAGVSVLSVMMARCSTMWCDRSGAASGRDGNEPGQVQRKPAGKFTRRETNDSREGRSARSGVEGAGARAGLGERGMGLGGRGAAARGAHARHRAATGGHRAGRFTPPLPPILHYTGPGLTLLHGGRYKKLY